jgi:hypothetical protein
MLTYGGEHCLDAAQPGDPGLGATYYDGTKVYLDIRDYTGDATRWTPCVNANLATYRGYVESSIHSDTGQPGAVSGPWIFTAGLRKHFEKTGDTRSRDAIFNIAKHAAFCYSATPLAWTSQAEYAREVYGCLNAFNDAEALGMARAPHHDGMLANAIGHFNMLFVTKTYRLCSVEPCAWDGPPDARGKFYIRPFMIGGEARALLADHQRRPDARIPPLVKAALDYMWARLWIPAQSAFPFENYSNTADSAWLMPMDGAPDLNQLIAVAYYDYAQATGDDSYRVKADAIFAGGVLGAWLDGGKQFNQSYEWSVDFVTRRR